MSFHDANQKEISRAVFLFLVLTTISGVVTTNLSQPVIVSARGIVAGLLVAQVTRLIVRFGVSKSQLSLVFLFLALLIYAMLRSLMLDAFDIGVINLTQDSLVIVSGLLVFGYLLKPSDVSGDLASIFLLYALIVVFGTVFVGGLSVDLLPRFVFEHSADELNRSLEQTYSLGVSRFFGFAAVVAAFCVAYKWKRLSGKALGLGLCLVFLSLSLMGGGRGEAIIATVLVLILLMKSRIGTIWIALVVMLVGLFLLPKLVESYDDLLFLRRFARLFEGDLSSRDTLLEMAVGLLRDQFSCLAMGCGVGFFQKYYGFNFALHPHNFVLEFLIVFGLPVFLVFVGLVVTGFVIYFKQVEGLDFLGLCYVYHFMVGMKSGYLFGSWIVFVLSLYFAGLALGRLRGSAL